MQLHRRSVLQLAAGALLPGTARAAGKMHSWPLATPRPTGIHDVAPAPDGGVWYTAQRSGHLGWFDPKSGRSELIELGPRSSPHGVVPGPDGAAWITDSGQNAIVRVGWPDRAVRRFPLPEGTPYAGFLDVDWKTRRSKRWKGCGARSRKANKPSLGGFARAFASRGTKTRTARRMVSRRLGACLRKVSGGATSSLKWKPTRSS